jgi:hypothetical protein
MEGQFPQKYKNKEKQNLSKKCSYETRGTESYYIVKNHCTLSISRGSWRGLDIQGELEGASNI